MKKASGRPTSHSKRTAAGKLMALYSASPFASISGRPFILDSP